MSSREIAELTGKDHKNVLADIRSMLDGLSIDWADFSAQYKDSTGRSLPCFNLPKRETLILVSGYNVQMRAAIIDRWQELEKVASLPDANAYSLQEMANNSQKAGMVTFFDLSAARAIHENHA